MDRLETESDQGSRAPSALLFDLDGVLIESYDVWFQLMNLAAERFDRPALDLARFDAMWGQGVDADAEYLECPIPKAEAFFNRHFMDFSNALQIDPAARGVLAAYREAGIPTALVTNTPSPLAHQILEAAELTLDTVVGGTDVPHSKPAPDVPLEACRRLGFAPGDVAMIGDSRFDREAAAAAGIFFIGLRIDGDRRIEDLEELPTSHRI